MEVDLQQQKKKKKKKKNRGTLAHFKSGASDKSETSSGPTKQTFIAQDLSNVNLNGNTWNYSCNHWIHNINLECSMLI